MGVGCRRGWRASPRAGTATLSQHTRGHFLPAPLPAPTPQGYAFCEFSEEVTDSVIQGMNGRTLNKKILTVKRALEGARAGAVKQHSGTPLGTGATPAGAPTPPPGGQSPGPAQEQREQRLGSVPGSGEHVAGGGQNSEQGSPNGSNNSATSSYATVPRHAPSPRSSSGGGGGGGFAQPPSPFAPPGGGAGSHLQHHHPAMFAGEAPGGSGMYGGGGGLPAGDGRGAGGYPGGMRIPGGDSLGALHPPPAGVVTTSMQGYGVQPSYW